MSATEKLDIDTLTGRELDAAVAEEVMGAVKDMLGNPPDSDVYDWRFPDGKVVSETMLVSYSMSHFAVREVEAEIEQQGLQYQYAAHLAKEFGIEVFGFTGKSFGNSAILASQAYSLITATPEQRSRAALRAVMG